MLLGAFICHASEDKADFVLPLAQKLQEEHVEVCPLVQIVRSGGWERWEAWLGT
jgi:hypothetical protein